MTLLDKSLKLALIASAALLTACPTTDEDKDTSEPADTDTDTDADTDTDTDADADTGITQFYFVADWATDAGAYQDFNFGYGFFGLQAEDWICTIKSNLAYEGEAPAGCPECEWSFDLAAAAGSTAEGEYCDQLGITDGYLDGYVDYSWGFAPTYYYDYNGTPLALENTLFLYVDYWFSFAFNYGGRDWVTGDGASGSLARPVISSGAYVYYYYYPY